MSSKLLPNVLWKRTLFMQNSPCASLPTADVFPVVRRLSLLSAGETKAEKTGCSRRLYVLWHVKFVGCPLVNVQPKAACVAGVWKGEWAPENAKKELVRIPAFYSPFKTSGRHADWIKSSSFREVPVIGVLLHLTWLASKCLNNFNPFRPENESVYYEIMTYNSYYKKENIASKSSGSVLIGTILD